jgi:hypothetical protein
MAKKVAAEAARNNAAAGDIKKAKFPATRVSCYCTAPNRPDGKAR